MQIFYKIFLVLFVLFIAVNLYGINWSVGVLHDENSKFISSIAASLLGIIVIFVMSNWSKLATKK